MGSHNGRLAVPRTGGVRHPRHACKPQRPGAHLRAHSGPSFLPPQELPTVQDNFAARMGRWSAQHRKKAIFGWIAFVIISLVVGGALGVKAPEDDADLRRRLGQGAPAGRRRTSRPRTSRASSSRRPRAAALKTPSVRAAVDDTIAAVSAAEGRLRRRVAVRQGQREPGLQGRPLGARELQAARRRDRRPRSPSAPILAATERVAGGQPGRLRRRVRRRRARTRRSRRRSRTTSRRPRRCRCRSR